MKRSFLIFKVIFMCLAFVVVGAITFAGLHAKQSENMVTVFQTSEIPVLYMKTESGRLINPAYGYAQDVDARGIFTGITPLDKDRNLDVAFYYNSSGIRKISYQVRDIETDQLLENTEIKEFEMREEYVNASINVKNLIEKDKEYLLTFKVTTDKFEELRYYGRIIWKDNLLVDEKIDFALQFLSFTYNKEELPNIVEWVETDETGDNTNFGRVNIHSTITQIGWGNLAPRIEGNVIPVIWEITPSVAQISLNYRVVTSSSSTEYEAYMAKDFYRLQQTRDKIFLMDYEREVNQIFDAYHDLQSSGRINLGIQSELTDIEAKADTTGKYSYFVQNGNVWCYSRNDNKFTEVFSFSASYTGRELEDDYQIKMIDVDGAGNAHFVVSGYMSGGKHDGLVGVSLFRYCYEENTVKELVFVPVNLPFNRMKDNVADVAYVNGDTFFIKLNQYLYSIDLVSGEYMLITDQLYEETYMVNKSGNRIAYHENHTTEQNHCIRIYDFETGTEKIIKGSDYGSGNDNDYLKIIGYIGDDLVYGMANPADVIPSTELDAIFPMHTIIILNHKYFVMKKYAEAGIYVSTAEIDGMRVNLWRVFRTEDGDWESTSIDQIMNKEENSAQNAIYTEIVNTAAREKELYLNIPTSSGNQDTVEVRYAKEILFQENGTYQLEDNYVFSNNYYVYAMGEYKGKQSSLRKAISQASSLSGYVMDDWGNYVYKKTEDARRYAWDSKNVVVSWDRYRYNLTGVSLENALYYVSTGNVLAAMISEDKYVYIYDYNKNDIFYYDSQLQKDVQLDRDTANHKFIQCGNRFLVLE